MGSDAADDSACPIPFFYMIGKFSELPYHTKSPPGGMHTRAHGRCCRSATALGARIPLCGILFHMIGKFFSGLDSYLLPIVFKEHLLVFPP